MLPRLPSLSSGVQKIPRDDENSFKKYRIPNSFSPTHIVPQAQQDGQNEPSEPELAVGRCKVVWMGVLDPAPKGEWGSLMGSHDEFQVGELEEGDCQETDESTEDLGAALNHQQAINSQISNRAFEPNIHFASRTFKIMAEQVFTSPPSPTMRSISIILLSSLFFCSSNSTTSGLLSVAFAGRLTFWINESNTELRCSRFLVCLLLDRDFMMKLPIAKQSLSCCLAYFSASNLFQPRLWKQLESCLQFCSTQKLFFGLMQTFESSTYLGWQRWMVSKNALPGFKSLMVSIGIFLAESSLENHWTRASQFSPSMV